MKCIRIFPDAWANTLCPFANSTRNMALGKFSLTVPSTSIVSFLAINSPGQTPPQFRSPETNILRESPALGQSEHFRLAVPDRHGVFEVRGQRAVQRAHGPVVRILLCPPVAQVHHRLDGDHHTGAQDLPGPGRPVVRDLRVLMHLTADPVPHVLAHHGHPLRLHVRLYGRADIADAGARAGGADAPPERLARDLDQPLRLRRDVPYTDRDR